MSLPRCCLVILSLFVQFGYYPLAGDQPLIVPARPLDVYRDVRITKDWCLSEHQIVKHSFTWTIERFGLLNQDIGEAIHSPKFPSESENTSRWRIELYPMGSIRGHGDYVAIFLRLLESKSNCPVKAKYKFAVLNDKGQQVGMKNTPYTIEFKLPVFGSSRTYGVEKFIKRDSLFESEAGLMPEERLTIYCEVELTNDTSRSTAGGPMSIAPPSMNKYRLADNLSHLFESQRLSNVTIRVGAREFKAHKTILAAGSPVFNAMFSHDMQESQLNRVEVGDVEPDVFEEVLRYIYSGKLSFGPTSVDKDEVMVTDQQHSFVIEVLKAAAKYQLDGLRLACEQYLHIGMSGESLIEVLSLIDQYDTSSLKSRALEFATTNANEITAKDGWKVLAEHSPETLVEVLSRLWPASNTTRAKESS